MKDKKYKVFSWRKGYVMSILGVLRKKTQDPNKILDGYIQKGMTVADVGCGMGYFSIPMLEMVGSKGKVVAFDLQEQMLEGAFNKAKKRNVAKRLVLNKCSETSLNMKKWENKFDFVLVFAMVHEAPDRRKLFEELVMGMKKGAKLLMAEPLYHVSKECFDESVNFAKLNGLRVVEEPQINRSRAVLFEKK